jgi:putative ABC transport system permease protein
VIKNYLKIAWRNLAKNKLYSLVNIGGLAALIAFPIAWISMNSWLCQFAYRIEISWWVFILAALSATLIALFTISFQAIRASMANPVDSLRS